MKVDPKNPVTQVAAAKAQPFKQLLAEAKSELKKPLAPTKATQPLPLVALKKTAATARTQATVKTLTTQAPMQVLARARVHADSEAQRLGAVRSEHTHTAHSLQQVRAEKTEAVLERGEARVLELIVKELQVDAPPANRQLSDVLPQQPIAASNAAPPKVEATPEAKAAQAVALIEKIERFVKSQRPGLALTLNNSLGAHVEIERIGPKEIALKLVGKNGPPTPEAVSRIREELRARGLRVGALSVG